MTSTTHSTDGEEPRVDQRMVDAANLHMHMTRHVQPPQAPDAEVAEIAKRHASCYNDLGVYTPLVHSDIAVLLRLLASRQPRLTEEEQIALSTARRAGREQTAPLVAIIDRLTDFTGQPAGESTMSNHKRAIAAALYFIGFVLTSGWMWTDPCPAAPGDEKCGSRGNAIFVGTYAGFVWPLYWNYKLFELVRKP